MSRPAPLSVFALIKLLSAYPCDYTVELFDGREWNTDVRIIKRSGKRVIGLYRPQQVQE